MSETAKIYGSGSGTHSAYAIEARTTYSEPVIHRSGMILTKEWQRVRIKVVQCTRSDHGQHGGSMIGDIPVHNFCPEADRLNLVDFDAAYAFAHLFLSQGSAEQFSTSLCMECRIVEVEVKYSYETRHLKDGEPISLHAKRRDYFVRTQEPA